MLGSASLMSRQFSGTCIPAAEACRPRDSSRAATVPAAVACCRLGETLKMSASTSYAARTADVAIRQAAAFATPQAALHCARRSRSTVATMPLRALAIPREDAATHRGMPAASINAASLNGSGMQSAAAADRIDEDDDDNDGLPKDEFAEEIADCECIEDIMDIIADEADVLSASASCVALHRMAGLSRRSKTAAEMEELVNSRDFVRLLRTVARNATAMRPVQVSQVLWSCAALRIRIPTLLSQLIAQITPQTVSTYTTKDIAVSVWALGQLRATQQPCTEALLDAAQHETQRFTMKQMSMLLHGMHELHIGSNDRGALLSLIASRVVEKLADADTALNMQAMTSILLSMSKLKHYDEALMNAACACVTQRMRSMSSWELLNFARACAYLNHYPGTLLEDIVGVITARDGDATASDMDLAMLTWACGRLGATLPEQQLTALSNALERAASNLAAHFACNALWGLALMRAVNVPAFTTLLRQVEMLYSRDAACMTPSLLRQVYQAYMVASLLHADVPLQMDEALRDVGCAAWMRSIADARESQTMRQVVDMLRAMKVPLQRRVSAVDGRVVVDIALRSKVDGRKCALQVNGGYGYIRNAPAQLAGSGKIDKQLLEADGWRVMYINGERFKYLQFRQQLKFLAAVVEELQVEIDEDAAAAAYVAMTGRAAARAADRGGRDRERGYVRDDPQFTRERRPRDGARGGPYKPSGYGKNGNGYSAGRDNGYRAKSIAQRGDADDVDREVVERTTGGMGLPKGLRVTRRAKPAAGYAAAESNDGDDLF